MLQGVACCTAIPQTSLEILERTILAFQDRFSNLAQPFAWKFTRYHLRRWLNKLSAQPLAA